MGILRLSNLLVLSLTVASPIESQFASLDCSSDSGIKGLYTMNLLKETPDSNVTYYFSPCEPVNIPECDADDYLCEVSYTSSGSQRVEANAVSYGHPVGVAESQHEVNGGESMMGYHLSFEKPGDPLTVVQLECGDATELSLIEGDHDQKLQLSLPGLCHLRPGLYTQTDSSDQWSVKDAVLAIVLGGMLAFCSGIVSLWLLLRLFHHKDETDRKPTLSDALDVVLSGITYLVSTAKHYIIRKVHRGLTV